MPSRVAIRRRRLDGVVLLNKPAGPSSQQAVSRVRHLLNAAKAGHTGTLDPAADGLLPVCLGEATKFTQRLLDADKRYLAKVRLGVVTTTGDAEGEVVSVLEPQVTAAALDAAVARFRGEIAQQPPMYSALKHQGKPLYEYARQGIEIERDVRIISIYESQVIDFKDDVFDIAVHCSKGTYIRVLAADIGEALGCGASLMALTRTGIADLALDHPAVCTLAALEAAAMEDRERWLLPVDTLAEGLPMLALGEAEAGRLLAGQRLRMVPAPALGPGLARVYGERVGSGAKPAKPQFLGLVEVTADGLIVPKRLLAANPENS
jgi:tRNA pseudouridine55 synthase